MGIVRAPSGLDAAALAETVLSSGLLTLEVTLNTPGAAQYIRELSRRAGSGLSIGAGTVMDLDDMHQALDAGAGFIVSPIVVEPVVDYCVNHAIPVFPGAYAPQDIFRAHSLGATMVKLFPAKTLGPVFIREMQGPFPDIPLLAVGGVTPENAGEFFQAGAAAVAVGGSVFRPEWLSGGDYARVSSSLKTLVSACRKK